MLGFLVRYYRHRATTCPENKLAQAQFEAFRFLLRQNSLSPVFARVQDHDPEYYLLWGRPTLRLEATYWDETDRHGWWPSC